MEDCIFCKIIARDIPSEVVYENDHTLAFLDISPVNPGHLLVIPKEHHPNFAATPEEVLKEVIAAARKVAPAVMEATGAPAFNIAVNNGSVAGQVVHHTHLHIMPRHEGDGHQLWKGTPYQPGEAEQMAERIRAALD